MSVCVCACVIPLPLPHHSLNRGQCNSSASHFVSSTGANDVANTLGFVAFSVPSTWKKEWKQFFFRLLALSFPASVCMFSCEHALHVVPPWLHAGPALAVAPSLFWLPPSLGVSLSLLERSVRDFPYHDHCSHPSQPLL